RALLARPHRRAPRRPPPPADGGNGVRPRSSPPSGNGGGETGSGPVVGSVLAVPLAPLVRRSSAISSPSVPGSPRPVPPDCSSCNAVRTELPFLPALLMAEDLQQVASNKPRRPQSVAR